MYVLDHNHPTELFRERQGLLAQEARDARLAKELRAPRRKERPTSERRPAAWFPRRAVALWGRSGIPFFRV